MIEFEAALLPGVKQPLEIRRTRIDRLEAGDVLVRIMASGLCHTDLEVIEGALAYPMPIVLGHEGAGVVEAVGAGVSDVKAGDHVVCSWNPHCGHCFYCDRDQPILCEPFTRHQLIEVPPICADRSGALRCPAGRRRAPVRPRDRSGEIVWYAQ